MECFGFLVFGGQPVDRDLFFSVDTVDGWNPVNSPVEVGSLSHFFLGFQHHPRWLFEISAIDSITKVDV